jgi:hypothetical protein
MRRIDTDPLPQKVTRMGLKAIHPCSAPNYLIGIPPRDLNASHRAGSAWTHMFKAVAR